MKHNKYFTNYKESKNRFQLVFIQSIFGQCCNTHQVDTNKPVTEGLVLRFHFAATNSIAQQCPMYYIGRCVRSYIGLLFVITDRCLIQLNYEYQIVPSPLYPFSSQPKVAITIEMLCYYPSPQKEDWKSLPNVVWSVPFPWAHFQWCSVAAFPPYEWFRIRRDLFTA